VGGRNNGEKEQWRVNSRVISCLPKRQCRKFVSHRGDIGHIILMLSLVFSYIVFSCLDIPVKHSLSLFIYYLKSPARNFQTFQSSQNVCFTSLLYYSNTQVHTKLQFYQASMPADCKSQRSFKYTQHSTFKIRFHLNTIIHKYMVSPNDLYN
jgi:hypothetical protein